MNATIKNMQNKALKLINGILERNWLRDLLSSLIFFCVLVTLDLMLRHIHRDLGLTPLTSIIPNTFTLMWTLMLTFAVRLLPQKAQRIAMGVIAFLAIILFLTNSMMSHAKGNFFSFSSMIFAADGFKFLDASYIKIRKILWACVFAGIAATAVAIWLVPAGKRKARWISALVVVLCIVGINANREKNLSDRVSIHYNSFQNSLLYEDFSNSNQCLLLTGLYQYSFRDFCLTYGVYDKLNRISDSETVEKLDEWYENKTIDEDNEWTGLFAGKNLILIQLESIDTWMITKEFMPNLYNLQKYGLDFTQVYTPLYLDAGTFNTEMIVNTGLVSPFTGNTSSMYSRNAYPNSLASLMVQEGYTANSFHRSDASVYNRGEIHKNWGYERYYSGLDLGVPAGNLDFDRNLMAGYKLMVSDENPFLTFIITYSGHGPYVDSKVSSLHYDYAKSLLPEGTPEMTIHAHAHAYETDLFIAMLLNSLRKDGLMDNTVLVFYTDHYNYYMLDTSLVMKNKGCWDMNLLTRTPFFIYADGITPQKIDKVCGIYDVLPTLVNLFDLDHDGRDYVGNDIFSPNGGYAIFADYSWFDGETYWYALSEETPTEEIAMRNEELMQRLQMSWDTMKLNYFDR